MNHQSSIEAYSQTIESLTHMYLGVTSKYYTESVRADSIMSKNQGSQMHDIRCEVARLAHQSFNEKAESASHFNARVMIFQNTVKIFGFGHIVVARASKAISSDSFRLCRSSGRMNPFY
ncbi:MULTISPECIES: hypothetical protein [unclassified Methylobacterium]|uniref:hypothetical protein n=1 Tax=unclassified Methylobacterium TaxID=2615210 RepID=UPI002269D1CF|nr:MULTISPECIES: hypothetical protein [unclassified Methylobacterium]